MASTRSSRPSPSRSAGGAGLGGELEALEEAQPARLEVDHRQRDTVLAGDQPALGPARIGVPGIEIHDLEVGLVEDRQQQGGVAGQRAPVVAQHHHPRRGLVGRRDRVEIAVALHVPHRARAAAGVGLGSASIVGGS